MTRRTVPDKTLLRLVVCLIAFFVLFAATHARLSQYQPVLAPSGIMVKATKMAECRFQKLSPDVQAAPQAPVPDILQESGERLPRSSFRDGLVLPDPILIPLRI